MSLTVVVSSNETNPKEDAMTTTTTDFFNGWHFDPDTGRWWPNKD